MCDSAIVHWGVMAKAVLVENNLKFINSTSLEEDLYKHRETVKNIMNATRTVSVSSLININVFNNNGLMGTMMDKLKNITKFNIGN